jgi:diacylglycerol kinase
MNGSGAKWDPKRLVSSFRWAATGVKHVIATEQNMRLHCAGAVAVFGAAAWLRVTRTEWCLLILCVMLVMAVECVNSALERLADRVSMEDHFLIRHAKDASAGGVLLVTMGAAAVGAVIFLPRIWQLVIR